MECFDSDYGAELSPKGADALRSLMIGSHSKVTEVMDMDPPIDSGFSKASKFDEKLTGATDAGNVFLDRGSRW